jgi:hypothetical protein
MKIEHIALYVNDLEAAKDFLSPTSAANPTRGITTRQPISAPTLSPLTAARGWS